MAINPTSSRMLTQNMQHVGGQRTMVQRKQTEPTTRENELNQDSVQLSGRAQDERGTQAATQTGSLQNMGRQTTGQVEEHKEDPFNQAVEHAVENGIQVVTQEPQAVPMQNPDQMLLADSTLAGAGGGIPPGGPGVAGGGAPPPQGPGGPGPGPATPPGASATPYTDAASKQQELQKDIQQAQTIYMTMAAERQKWMAQMWQIMQDLQTSIMQIMQETALRRAKTMDAIAAKWSAALGGYG